MFYSGSLEGFVGLMHGSAQKAVQKLSAAVKSKEAINAQAVLSAMTMQVMHFALATLVLLSNSLAQQDSCTRHAADESELQLQLNCSLSTHGVH